MYIANYIKILKNANEYFPTCLLFVRKFLNSLSQETLCWLLASVSAASFRKLARSRGGLDPA